MILALVYKGKQTFGFLFVCFSKISKHDPVIHLSDMAHAK